MMGIRLKILIKDCKITIKCLYFPNDKRGKISFTASNGMRIVSNNYFILGINNLCLPGIMRDFDNEVTGCLYFASQDELQKYLIRLKEAIEEFKK